MGQGQDDCVMGSKLTRMHSHNLVAKAVAGIQRQGDEAIARFNGQPRQDVLRAEIFLS